MMQRFANYAEQAQTLLFICVASPLLPTTSGPLTDRLLNISLFCQINNLVVERKISLVVFLLLYQQRESRSRARADAAGVLYQIFQGLPGRNVGLILLQVDAVGPARCLSLISGMERG